MFLRVGLVAPSSLQTLILDILVRVSSSAIDSSNLILKAVNSFISSLRSPTKYLLVPGSLAGGLGTALSPWRPALKTVLVPVDFVIVLIYFLIMKICSNSLADVHWQICEARHTELNGNYIYTIVLAACRNNKRGTTQKMLNSLNFMCSSTQITNTFLPVLHLLRILWEIKASRDWKDILQSSIFLFSSSDPPLLSTIFDSCWNFLFRCIWCTVWRKDMCWEHQQGQIVCYPLNIHLFQYPYHLLKREHITWPFYQSTICG